MNYKMTDHRLDQAYHRDTYHPVLALDNGLTTIDSSPFGTALTCLVKNCLDLVGDIFRRSGGYVCQ